MEWKVLEFKGEWVRGVNAGGCGNTPHQGNAYYDNAYINTSNYEDRGFKLKVTHHAIACLSHFPFSECCKL